MAALADLVEGFVPRSEGGVAAAPAGETDDAVLVAADLRFGPPILRPPSFRDFYAFEGHVRTMWERRGGEVPEAWYRLPIFYFSNVAEIRGPDEPVWAPRASKELDYELEVGALIDTSVTNLSAEQREEAIGGFFVLNDWSARDLQRDETAVRLGPAKGKDFATSIGPWLVTPDELGDARQGTGYDLAMTATVNGNETSRGTWSSAQFSFGQMIAAGLGGRPAAAGRRARLGHGRRRLPARGPRRDDRTLSRAGRQVVLAIERLGALRTPVVARPG